jgi:hypothetical protein
VPQGVGGAEANGGPSLEGFAPSRPPRTAATDGRGPSDLIATARWDADGISRGCPPYKWKTLPTFLLTSVGELGVVSLTSHASLEAIH